MTYQNLITLVSTEDGVLSLYRSMIDNLQKTGWVEEGKGMRTFLWTGYAASPRLLRYCIGLSHPSFSFGRSSL